VSLRCLPVISCEHASNALPGQPDLALSQEVLASHAAWDPGARPVAARLADAAGAPLFLGTFSRLFVDLNRSPGSPEVVPSEAFGVAVPANAALDERARRARIRTHHAPYWNGVRAAAEAAIARGRPVLQLSVHSFTPDFPGQTRDLDLGVLFDPARALERRAAEVLLVGLREAGFDAKENAPYDGRSDSLTRALRQSFADADYAGIEIEISQRLLDRIDQVGAALTALVPRLY
jgi:predicted N-formylglutamate amidohydrolase